MVAGITHESDEPVGKVMVVDDEPQNRELLRDMLHASGHSVVEARDGEEALKRVQETLPDVVLLDLMMPRIDGFEVCRCLKRDPATAPVPVLLVTSVTDRESRLIGIRSGANDFLSKPIDREDLLLRVRNAIVAKRLFDQLQQSYERLQQLEVLRDNLTHMIVHDLRSPLTGILASIQLLETTTDGRLTAEEQRYLRTALSSTTMLTDLVSSILDVNRLEAGEMPLRFGPCDLRKVISEAVKHFELRAQLKQIQLNVSSEKTLVHCDEVIVGRIVGNLLNNAIKFTPQGGRVGVAVEREFERIRVIVSDTGIGIPKEYYFRIFEKFSQVKNRRENQMHSTGLGLTFCKLAIEAHGGNIGVESEIGVGSRFWFTLPEKTVEGS
jgi:signal transduction histidine kinase